MDTGFINNYRRYALWISLLSVVVAVLVMIGWWAGWEPILYILPGASTMKFNTALGFFFLGIALWSSCYLSGSRQNMLILVLAILNMLIGGISLVEYIWSPEIGIDTFFASDPYSTAFPGRMSPGTALNFFICGVALLTIFASKQIRLLGQYLLLVVGLVSLVSIVSYVMNVEEGHKLFVLDTMAIHTAILFLPLSIGFSLKNPQMGPIGLFIGNLQGHKVARSVLPLLLIFPVVINLIIVREVSDGSIFVDFGITLATVIFILASMIYLAVMVTNLNRSDLSRRGLEQSIHQKNAELETYKAALDRSSMVAITDTDGLILEVNEVFRTLTQYENRELRGKSIGILNSGHHPEEFFEQMWGEISKGNTWSGELKNRTRDGQNFWVHASIIPFYDEEGGGNRYMLMGQELKGREQVLQEQNTRLTLRNKELEHFAYIASHDLQEPIRSIQGYVNILKTEYASSLDGEGKNILQFLSNASQRMSELVQGLMGHARIAPTGPKELVDLTQLVNGVRSDLKVLISEHDGTVEVSPLPAIEGYSVWLHSLFQNLISNAIKYHRKGIAPYVQIFSEKTDEGLLISVKDNGMGIKPEYQEKIFLMFQRLHRRPEYGGIKGTGLGLTNARKIAELHDGFLRVHSTPGEGSTFTFVVPAKGNTGR